MTDSSNPLFFSQMDTLTPLYLHTFQRIEEIMKRTRKGDQSDLKVSHIFNPAYCVDPGLNVAELPQ